METDLTLFLWVNRSLSGEAATLLFTTITHLGNGLVLAVLVLPSLYFLKRADFKQHALPLVIAVALSGGLVNILKPIVDRPRPGPYFENQGMAIHVPAGTPPDKAFPSGHTQTAFGTAVYLSLMYPVLSPLFLTLAALVGLSRMAIGVHYPLDVLVGALFGTGFSIAGFRVAVKRQRARSD
jgi:undecaprenyl-diphosphatase